MKIINFNKIKSVIIGSAWLPLLTFAQAPFLQGELYRGNRRLGTFNPVLNIGGSSTFGLCYVIDIMNRFITWVQVILFSVAVIMALYAAYLYITEGYGGKGENITKAKNTLVYAAVGVGVALLAYAIVPLVSSFLSVPYYEQCF